MTVATVQSVANRVGGAPAEPDLVQGTPDWDLHLPATAVDAKDADTPDAWVPRDPRIQRLTGRHPLNCEAPMDVLMASGFITPPSIHYVRNHGAVPKIHWGNHRIHINGLVDKPLTISMDELVAMPSVTLPVGADAVGFQKGPYILLSTYTLHWSPYSIQCSPLYAPFECYIATKHDTQSVVRHQCHPQQPSGALPAHPPITASYTSLSCILHHLQLLFSRRSVQPMLLDINALASHCLILFASAALTACCPATPGNPSLCWQPPQGGEHAQEIHWLQLGSLCCLNLTLDWCTLE